MLFGRDGQQGSNLKDEAYKHNNHTRGFMMEGQQHGDRLKRGLKNRHIQLIALGGAIGTGLFWVVRQ